MNNTELLKPDDATNPPQSAQKDQSVDANQNLEGKKAKTKNKKKFNKILTWCGQCCGRGRRKVKKKVKKIKRKRKERKRRKKERRGEKRPGRWSIFARLKNSRCWGRQKKKGTAGRKRRVEEDERDEREEIYERRAGTSRDARGRVTIDTLPPSISKGRDPSHPGKSISYAAPQRAYKTSGKAAAPLQDIAKSCCYLCAENSLAIATAMSLHPIFSDKSINVRVNETLESSCSPMNVHVKTVKSLLKVKIRDTCTSSAGFPEERKVDKPKKKKKKLRFFPKIRRAECPVRQHVGCVTESSTLKKCEPCAKPKLKLKSKPKSKPKPKSKEKEKKKFEPCCRDKAI